MVSKDFKREFRIMKSTLNVSKNKDVRGTKVGDLLLSKGFISKNTGMITEKGKKALKLL